jgi:hypothetical protein
MKVAVKKSTTKNANAIKQALERQPDDIKVVIQFSDI